MNILKGRIHFHTSITVKWLHKQTNMSTNFKFNENKVMGKRLLKTNSYTENYLKDILDKGQLVNVLGLVISNNNLCYCLLKNKVIKKIGIINIKKDLNSYDENYYNYKHKKSYAKNEKENVAYNSEKEESPFNFNIREILSILNFMKLQSEGDINEMSSLKCNESIINESNDESQKNRIIENEKRNITEWIIGIEKVNEKYEKNRIKEKILSILVYFLQSIFQCRIMYFCPKEARKYFSNKCNFHLTNREITYKYIKQKIADFPRIENKKNESLNYIFSDCYIIAFYTHRYYMHELVKNNKTIFNHLEKEVRKNKRFNNILTALKKADDDDCKQDLREVLKDKIKKIVENETYKLVDRYIS